MNIRSTQTKWVTERHRNTQEIRRNTLTQRTGHIHSKRKIQAGLMMVPPISESMISPHKTRWQRHSRAKHKPDYASTGVFLGGEGVLVKTKLTAGCLSPTIITSQHHIIAFLRLHFHEGLKGGLGKEGKRDVTTGAMTKCWAGQHTYREGTYNGNN